VGGHSAINVDVRIIAATHQNLERLVTEGRFREDLFHRLNVIRVYVPALRERREDIPALMKKFLKQAANELTVEVKTLHPKVEEWLKEQEWPGNVRQLENLSRWLTVMASGREIQLLDLPGEMLEQTQSASGASQSWESALRQWATQKFASGDHAVLDIAVPRFEQIMIETALANTGGRKQDAAKLLGWGRNTLTRKLKELGMNI
jgi:two-component system nitrogen regulation response regulator GlnG